MVILLTIPLTYKMTAQVIRQCEHENRSASIAFDLNRSQCEQSFSIIIIIIIIEEPILMERDYCAGLHSLHL